MISQRISGATSISDAQSQKIGKPNNLKVFGSLKTTGPKQGSRNLPGLPMPERG